MGLVVSYTADDGTVYPSSYMRLHTVMLSTVPVFDDAQTVTDFARGPLVATFFFYPSEAVRKSGAWGAEVGREVLRLPRDLLTMSDDIEAQAWSAVKLQPEYSDGIDRVE